jgi:hypothetical protein
MIPKWEKEEKHFFWLGSETQYIFAIKTGVYKEWMNLKYVLFM